MNILQLTDILATKLVEENNSYHIKAIIDTPLPTICFKCFAHGSIIRNGTTKTLIRDLPMHAKPVAIYLSIQRYKCKSCSNITYQSSKTIDESHRMTKRLVEYIINKSYQTTFTEIAHEIKIDEKTVRNVFANKIDNQLKQLAIETPEVLGIDEVHLIGKPRCVITNIEHGTIVDILKTRNKSVLMTYFTTLKNNENIRVVTMDMWRPYYDVISTTLPQATIVIDKLHVVRMASDAMEKVRKNIRATLSQKERIQLKNDRFILLKRNHQLTQIEKISINSWFARHKILGEAYELKEGFYNIWKCQTKKDAEHAYTEWKNKIPIELIEYFAPIVSTIANWHKPIFNYFTSRYTNATTEALNGLIKIMNRDGRGYSFEVLKAKMLLSNGMQKTIENPMKFHRISKGVIMEQCAPGRDKNFGTSIEKLVNFFENENSVSTNKSE